jgi:hypothetical protein
MNKKILVIIGVTLVLVLVILFFLKPNQKNENKNILMISPTITPGVTRVQSKTGAEMVTWTQEEEKAAAELSKLRLAAPVDTGDFVISMNWNEAVFVVEAKNSNIDKTKLWNWLRQNGYESIKAENFKFSQ